MSRKRLIRWSLHGVSPLALAAAVALFTLKANALSCNSYTFKLGEAYEEADSIIVGVITACREAESSEAWVSGDVDCSFDSVEVLKESTTARDYRGTATSSGCGLSLKSGDQYLLFLDGDNSPMYASAALSGEHASTSLAREHVRILRAFRDGQVADLADPWMLHEGDDMCRLTHVVDNTVITFAQLKIGAPTPPLVGLTREIVDGKTVFRTQPGGASMPPDMEYIFSGDIHEYPEDVPAMSVSFNQRDGAAERSASVRVGDQTWPLLRRKMTVLNRGMEIATGVEYLALAGTAEDILEAMQEPSEVVVSARLVAPQKTEPDPPAATQQTDPDESGRFQLEGIFPSVPQPSVDVEPGSAAVGSVNRGANRIPQVTPEPVLRLETRSTQLPKVIDRYRACVGSEGRQRRTDRTNRTRSWD